eukprot:3847401-Heterocapsa_arctica.AAC.2
MEKTLVNRGVETTDTLLKTNPTARELRRASVEMLLSGGDTVLQSTGGSPRGVNKDTQADKMGDPTENLGGTRVIQGTETGWGHRAK